MTGVGGVGGAKRFPPFPVFVPLSQADPTQYPVDELSERRRKVSPYWDAKNRPRRNRFLLARRPL